MVPINIDLKYYRNLRENRSILSKMSDLKRISL